MQIKYLGHASFLIKTKDAKVVTDPYDAKVGLKFPKVEADIVTVSHSHFDHNAVNQVGGSPTVFDWPGEYEKMGVRIFGFKTFHDKEKGKERGENIIFKIESEGISIVHCGDLGWVVDDEFVDQLGEVDILMIPVGGFYTINAQEAQEVVKRIEPSIVIPMHFGHSGLSSDLSSKLEPVSEFLKKMGIEKEEPVEQLNIKKDELQQEIKVITLKI